MFEKKQEAEKGIELNCPLAKSCIDPAVSSATKAKQVPTGVYWGPKANKALCLLRKYCVAEGYSASRGIGLVNK